MSRITMEVSCDGHSASVCVTMTELRLSTPEGGVQYFMHHAMRHYRGETIRLELTLFDGSTHAHYNLRATDQTLQGIADQWVKQIKDALL